MTCFVMYLVRKAEIHNEARGEVLSRVVFLVFKHLYTGELKKRLPSILALLEELQDKQTGLEYALAVSG